MDVGDMPSWPVRGQCLYMHLVSQYVRHDIACFLFLKGREDNKMMIIFLLERFKRELIRVFNKQDSHELESQTSTHSYVIGGN